MTRALIALALSGCITTAGIVKRDDGVGLPLLAGATGADLVAASVLASQIQDYTLGASLATGLAFTALDLAIGCLIGACSSLRP